MQKLRLRPRPLQLPKADRHWCCEPGHQVSTLVHIATSAFALVASKGLDVMHDVLLVHWGQVAQLPMGSAQ